MLWDWVPQTTHGHGQSPFGRIDVKMSVSSLEYQESGGMGLTQKKKTVITKILYTANQEHRDSIASMVHKKKKRKKPSHNGEDK